MGHRKQSRPFCCVASSRLLCCIGLIYLGGSSIFKATLHDLSVTKYGIITLWMAMSHFPIQGSVWVVKAGESWCVPGIREGSQRQGQSGRGGVGRLCFRTSSEAASDSFHGAAPHLAELSNGFFPPGAPFSWPSLFLGGGGAHVSVRSPQHSGVAPVESAR